MRDLDGNVITLPEQAPVEPSTKVSPFVFVEAITNSQHNIIRQSPNLEKEYIPFVVNRSLSNFSDTIIWANEMNSRPTLPHQIQFDFLFYGISKKKRWAKWAKPEVPSDKLRIIQDYYKYSIAKARAVAPLISEEQLKIITQRMSTGGTDARPNSNTARGAT